MMRRTSAASELRLLRTGRSHADRRLQYVPVLADHQHRDEVNDGQRKELSLLRLLLHIRELYRMRTETGKGGGLRYLPHHDR